MLTELIRTMYDYNAWANRRILDTCALAPDEELRRDVGASFGSIHDSLVHIMGGQWMFLARWRGKSPSAMLDPRSFADLAAIRKRWDMIERDTREFVAAAGDAQLAAVVEYVNTEGERWAYPLWQQMIHQVNHATQHRSEVAMALTSLGHSPGWLDFLYFLDVSARR